MYANLFDRFVSDGDGNPRNLAEDLADLLGSRQMTGGRGLGVLAWGMPPMLNLTAMSPTDRRFVAESIAEAIQQFEPRLERVKVTPIDGAKEFAFTIEAYLVEESSTLRLRILSPYVGGSLGAKVDIVNIREQL